MSGMETPAREGSDVLTRNVIDLATLRTMIVDLQKDGFTEINMHDLLIYIKPMCEDRNENDDNENPA